ncbi:uroporphyrinogen-III synthase [Roseobacter sp.]|uniref:uroporphyrinogen-III synthase n=1 Tax=Roseobacter sp. TaxID=1907202 RepID=UPI00329880AD
MRTPRISLIMTRPARANTQFIDQLSEDMQARLDIVESPLINVVSVRADYAVGPDESVIFSSANGVRHAPAGRDRRAFCVGHATTKTAHNAGWHAIFAGETAEALVVFLTAYPIRSHIWHLAGRHTRGEIAETLNAQGISATRITTYDQTRLPLTDQAIEVLGGSDPVVVPLFSPRTAVQFVQECPKTARPHVVALSEAVAEPLAHFKLKTLDISSRPTAAEMICSLEKTVARISLG